MSATTMFDRYIGIDYSGAETPTSSRKGLRVFMAVPDTSPWEVEPPLSPRKYWTRRRIAEWLSARLADSQRTLVGIDHGFSFPLPYFERHGLPHDWLAFLEDFQRHWPTGGDHQYVDFVRDGISGNGAARTGDSRWRRVTEVRAGAAKSVFHFDVPGSVAKSTHAGLPWLLHLRRQFAGQIHFWPFEGWKLPEGHSVVAEVYPALWIRSFPREGRDNDQHDAYSSAAWMRQADQAGTLGPYFDPQLNHAERNAAKIEGWILGVA